MKCFGDRLLRESTALLTILLAAAVASAQPGKLEGKVTQKDGTPFVGVTVILKDNRTAGVLEEKPTKPDGSYTFDLNRDDVLSYRIRFEHPACPPITVWGLPSRAAHSINPVLKTYEEYKLDMVSLQSIAQQIRTALAIGPVPGQRSKEEIPAWAVAGAAWMTKATRKLEEVPASVFDDFNAVASALIEGMNQTQLTGSGGKSLSAPLVASGSAPDRTKRQSTPSFAIWSGHSVQTYRIVKSRRPAKGKGAGRYTYKPHQVRTVDTKRAAAEPDRPSDGDDAAVVLPVDPRTLSPKLFEVAQDRAILCSAGFNRGENLFQAIDLDREKSSIRSVSVPASVRLLTLSPDGKTIASVTQDRVVVDLRQLAENSTRQTLRTGRAAVLTVRFSPDGKCLAVGTATGQVQLWDLEKAKRIASYDAGDSFITALAFLDNGQRLAVGTGLVGAGKVLLLERTPDGFKVRDRKSLLKPALNVIDILVAPDSSKLVVIPGGKQYPLVFSLAEGKFADATPQQIKQHGHVLFLDDKRIGVLSLEAKGPKLTVLDP
jgi:hypothetical protein